MTPFQPAKLNMPPVREFIADSMRHGVTRKQAKALYNKMRKDKVYLNDTYQVNVAQLEDGMTHLSVKRIDRAPIHDWRDLQAIKNQIAGPEREAVEIYPSESRKVDTANQYHLWVFPAGFALPIGFNMRAVTDEPGFNAVQRPGAESPMFEAAAATPASDESAALDLLREALEYRTDHFDNETDFDSYISGADLIDWFGRWRAGVKERLPSLTYTKTDPETDDEH